MGHLHEVNTYLITIISESARSPSTLLYGARDAFPAQEQQANAMC